MSYIGRQNLGGAYRQLDDISSGFDGSDTTHTMQVNSQNVTVGDVNQIILSLGGVIQKPGTDFTVSGSTLTFTTAPAANTSFFAILLGSDNGGTVTPTDGSVTGDKLASNIAITTSGDISFDGGSFVFNESSADKDFRIETNGNANMFLVDGGNDAVIFNGSTSNFASSSQAIQIYNSGLAFTSGYGIQGGVNADRASINLTSGASGHTVFKGNNSETARILNDGTIATGGETAPDCDAGGLTLDQNANDAKILTLKSSDVAHSITSDFEADTYATFQKSGSTDGGLRINGVNDSGNIALQLRGFSNGGEDTGKGTGDHGCVRIDALSRSGTTGAGQGANVNMVTICNQNTVRFIFDAEGDLHSDSSNTTFDAYEDAQLVRAYDLSHGKGVIASKFDDFVKYNQDDLIDAGLVGRINHEYNTDGTKATPLINMSGFMRLHNGAIWQQYEKHQKLANAMYELAKAAVGEEKANEILEKNDIKLLN